MTETETVKSSVTPSSNPSKLPKTPSFKRGNIWRSLHRWLVYSLGLIFIVQGLTGSLMVLGGPLDAWFNPEMVPKDHTVPLVDIADELDRKYPQSVALGVKRQDDAGQLIVGFWPEPDPIFPEKRNFRLASINASNGEIVSENSYGALPQSSYDYLGYLYAIHTNLTLGVLGHFFLIFTTTGLLVLLVAGVMNWRNRRNWLKHKATDKIVDSKVAKWHRRLGLSSVLVLGILLASGLALQYETLLDPSFTYQSEDREGQQSRLPLRQAWQLAQQKYPDARGVLILAPFWEGGTFRIDLEPQSGEQVGKTMELFLDAYSGRTLYERSSDEREGLAYWISLLESLHGGSILGTFGEVLAFITGLIPILMIPLGWLAVRKLRRKLAKQS